MRWWGLLGVVLVALALVAPRAASARDAELVASLSASSDPLPTRICVHAAKLGKELADNPAKTLSDLTPGSSSYIKTPTPTCTTKTTCNECKLPPPASGGVVCWLSERVKATADAGKAPPEPERDLHLQLVGAGLKTLTVDGTDVIMKVEVGDVQAVRLRSLGGAYYIGFAHAVGPSWTIQLGLRSRCVERLLSYSVDPGSAPGLAMWVKTDSHGTHRAYTPGQPIRLEVAEEGKVTAVTLQRGTTEYTGIFSYPSTGPVELLATKFDFTWPKSSFVKGRRNVQEWDVRRVAPPKTDVESKAWLSKEKKRECPGVWLVREGVECPVSSQDDHECNYTCNLTDKKATTEFVKFPARVRFELSPPQNAATEPPIKWEEDLLFPNANLSSLPPDDHRRVYLVWPREEKAIPGEEWDALEITGADEKKHRLENRTVSLPVHGLQSPATFSYRYLGRGPYRDGVIEAQGDILVIPEPSVNRRSVVLGADIHGGTLWRPSLDSRRWSPTIDADLIALIANRWEIWLSGMVTSQPSVLNFEGQPAQWSSALQARLLAGSGIRLRPSSVCYLDFGIGAGLATRLFEKDWSRARPQFSAALRARLGYDISHSLAFEPFITLWYPESYVVQSQDFAGPKTPTVETAFSLNFGLGLRWADIF